MQLQNKIENTIHEVRNQKMILDAGVADTYGTNARTLKQAVRLNISRFPSGFTFELLAPEFLHLTSQNVISSHDGARHAPFAARKLIYVKTKSPSSRKVK